MSRFLALEINFSGIDNLDQFVGSVNNRFSPRIILKIILISEEFVKF